MKKECVDCEYIENVSTNEINENNTSFTNEDLSLCDVKSITEQNIIIDNEILEESDAFLDEESNANNTLYCTYCGKLFKHKSSRSRHEKQYCQYNERIPYSRLVDLLNNKNDLIMKIDGENKSYDTKLNQLKDKIKTLVDKIECIETGYENKNDTKSSKNINAILNINNYHQTNYDFLTKTDFVRCIRDCNKCVPRLVERVHFNPNRPENMNIFVSSYQGKFLMIYRNGKWIMRPKKSEVDTLFEEKELILENWLDEFGEQYPELVHKYKRYINNKNSAGVQFINELKNEIVMLLYNNRDMVLKHVYDGKSFPLIKAL